MTPLAPSTVAQIARNRLAERAGATGKYSAWHDAVCVYEYQANMAGDVMMAPTWTHELTHAAQRRRIGILGYFAAKTALRHKLEAEAVAEERRAQTILKVGVL